MKNKKRKSNRFSLMIVPRGSSNIRRVELSRTFLHGAGIAFCIIAFLLCFGIYSLFSYRNAYFATEGVRQSSSQFVAEKALLIKKISDLQNALARIERFTSKIESAVDVPVKSGISSNGFMGIGPIDDEVSLSSTAISVASLGSIEKVGNAWNSNFSKSLTSDLSLTLGDISGRLDDTETRIHRVFAAQKDKGFFWASLPTIWPTNGWITSEFGDRRSWGGVGRVHKGIDIAGPRGTPILAPGHGMVTYTGYRRGYGRTVMIDHGYGITTLYGHCQRLFVKEGQEVKRGMIVASIGNTGRSTGPHLHYEVQVDGVPVNPLLYIMNEL